MHAVVRPCKNVKPGATQVFAPYQSADRLGTYETEKGNPQALPASIIVFVVVELALTFTPPDVTRLRKET
jgi:hypothetical protein